MPLSAIQAVPIDIVARADEIGLALERLSHHPTPPQPAATELMRKWLADEKEAVQVQAAIALYRLTGEKVKQFPAGYRAD